MLQEHTVTILGDELRLSLVMRCRNENSRSFRFIKRTVLSTLNAFLESRFSKAPGHGQKIEFFKVENSGRRTGLFDKNRHHGMLEAVDCDTADNVSSLLGALVGSCNGLSSTLKGTSVLTGIVGMTKIVHGWHRNFERIEESKELLE